MTILLTIPERIKVNCPAIMITKAFPTIGTMTGWACSGIINGRDIATAGTFKVNGIRMH